MKAQGRTLTGDVEPGAGHFFRSDHFPLAKAGVPAVSISDPEHYIGKDPAFAKKQRDDYTNNRYHQPSDECSDSWDLAGAISDLKALATLGWQVAAAPQMPRYNPNEQFAAPRLAVRPQDHAHGQSRQPSTTSARPARGSRASRAGRRCSRYRAKPAGATCWSSARTCRRPARSRLRGAYSLISQISIPSSARAAS